ncbi:hypothetical protein [Saccharothrix australiensis]|uniref:Pentapeptide repeat protein n=1 Tax=Saccharothrix australiensis TaxID=2072 RepID=A0A495W6N7_9PSEU|nr:hypothetical protein [Saccharothrix australiensis]RKT57391.1 hypothetical protein C8E97_6111 [Saccharothrix australiensis]
MLSAFVRHHRPIRWDDGRFHCEAGFQRALIDVDAALTALVGLGHSASVDLARSCPARSCGARTSPARRCGSPTCAARTSADLGGARLAGAKLAGENIRAAALGEADRQAALARGAVDREHTTPPDGCTGPR